MNTIDLRITLIDSAQCFHWREENGVFYGAADGRAYALSDDTVRELTRYLDLDRDYSFLLREYGHIPAARLALERFPGLRVLRQSPWETLVAFILSANNNVSRIRSLVNKVCAAYGERFEVNGVEIFGFPLPERLSQAEEGDLRALGMGYRAPYLLKTARMVADGFSLEELRGLSYGRAHARLLSLPGVGDKVADCIQLFGLGFEEAFPADVWVLRLMETQFGVTGSAKQVSAKAREMFGHHGGILQQYLFHAARMGLLDENGSIRT